MGAAVRVLREVVEREPESGVAWYRLGMALQEGGNPDEAVPALERAARLGYQAAYAWVRVARARATSGEGPEALEALEKADEAGLDAPALLEHDDLTSLSREPRFLVVLREANVRARPCAVTDEYRAFDFWIGRWNVFDPAGNRIGKSRVESLLDSCALMENWTDARGNSGKSLNVYDRTTGRWRQLWVSDRGNVMDYAVGGPTDGAMRFEGVVRTGGDVLRRMVFTPVAPDTVRQEIFQSEDDGASWTSQWTGIYVRAEGKEAGEN